MAKLDELLKAFRSREGIKGTTVAKMMSRKEAGNYTTIGSRVSNPFINPKFNVSTVGRDQHYFLLNRYLCFYLILVKAIQAETLVMIFINECGQVYVWLYRH